MNDSTTQWRVTYIFNGRSQYTGVSYSRANAVKALPSMRASSDRGNTAWIECSTDGGRTWRVES